MTAEPEPRHSDERRRARLLEQLEEAAAALEEAPTLDDVAAVMIAHALELLDADAGYLGVLSADGRTLDVARVTPYGRTPVRFSFPLDAPYPLTETWRTRQPLFLASNEQLTCDHPGLVRVQPEDHACATLPLVDEQGELLAALNLGFADPHEFTDEERELIGLVGDYCARTVARGRAPAG